jgi:hypothetical protein
VPLADLGRHSGGAIVWLVLCIVTAMATHAPPSRPSSQRHLLARRLVRPIGLLLVAGCFLLPFVTVSCSPASRAASVPPDWPRESTFAVTYTGTDLGARARPRVSFGTDETLNQQLADLKKELAEDVPRLRVQPLIVAFVLVLVGVAAVALRSPWARDLAGAATAILAIIFLIGGQLIALHRVHRGVEDFPASKLSVDPNDVPAHNSMVDVLDVGTGYGFWLALMLLLAIGTASVAQLVRSSTRTADPVPAGLDNELLPPASG